MVEQKQYTCYKIDRDIDTVAKNTKVHLLASRKVIYIHRAFLVRWRWF